MTKLVRIENADTSNFAVEVQMWTKGAPLPALSDEDIAAGLGQNGSAPDHMEFSMVLTHPTQMTDSRFYLTSSRYIVVKEVVSAV